MVSTPARRSRQLPLTMPKVRLERLLRRMPSRIQRHPIRRREALLLKFDTQLPRRPIGRRCTGTRRPAITIRLASTVHRHTGDAEERNGAVYSYGGACIASTIQRDGGRYERDQLDG